MLVTERTGLLITDPAGTMPVVRMTRVVQAAIRAAMPNGMVDRAARAAAGALLEVWPEDDQPTWLAEALRACAASASAACVAPPGDSRSACSTDIAQVTDDGGVSPSAAPPVSWSRLRRK